MNEKAENKPKKRPLLIRMFRNKYTLTLFIFIVWIALLDKNNLIERQDDIKVRNQLIKDKKYYQEQIENDRQRINELMSNKENLEKFAREQYLMKKENEEIFMILHN
ncbi:MAG: hypothetical protein A2W91_03190 [Bacteroidetes bacterium GWF2_38_335]|nr:MAG: hypothetical protein A2W91_03190 [Bacteroidetes bacterium GWF2_38_335]OFY77505.1 MAG: hypothetical protein A2281_01570 [Bacteroidetes bacterium RIFOXYA12_FULL_38_20]HBS87199.1 septum formation inhibitor [Bacteroidales bacterium]